MVDKKQLLVEARDEIYSLATNDLTCQLSKEVMAVGLAKLKFFYKELGYDPSIPIVLFGPDGGITRNKKRFSQGVGYGCVVATKEYIFPSMLHPNGCGYGLFRIEKMESITTVMKNIMKMKEKGVIIDDQLGKWDVSKSNHFIDIFQLKEQDIDDDLGGFLEPGTYALIHSSQQTEKEKLSYWRKEEFTQITTPFGVVSGLSDDYTHDYFNFFATMEKYSQQKRLSIAHSLFGKENVITVANVTHQGYYDERNIHGYYVMRLGLADSTTKSGEKKLPLFPLGFNAYSFSYLYFGLKNVDSNCLTLNQFERAKNLGHLDYINKSNILPHGGGYKLIYPFSKVKPIIFNDAIFFKLSHAPVRTEMIINGVDSLEFGYRNSTEILPLVERLGLGTKIAQFFPKLVLKC